MYSITAALFLVATVASGQEFSVLARGGVCDGVTDIGPVLQQIMQKAVSGSKIIFPAGVCVTSVPLVLGDGTPYSVSTRQHFTVIGAGMGHGPAEAFPVSSGTKIVYTGFGGAVIDIRGPMSGVEISSLSIDANARADYGIRLEHTYHSSVRRVTITQPRVGGLLLEGTTSPMFGLAIGAGSNVIEEVAVTGDVYGSSGFIIGADNLRAATSQNYLKRCGVLGCTNGFLLRFADYLKMEMCQAMYSLRPMYFQPPTIPGGTFVPPHSRTMFPANVLCDSCFFSSPPTWAQEWNPGNGVELRSYLTEWNGYNSADSNNFGPLFPKHPAIWGNDSNGFVYPRGRR